MTHFPPSPRVTDMVAVAELYRAVLDERTGPEAAMAALHGLVGATPFVDGYIRGREGMGWAAEAAG